MSYEKDPHVREREIAYYFGGARVPLKLRPSKYSRIIDHPWMEISLTRDFMMRQRMARYLLSPYNRIKTPGKLHIHCFTATWTRMMDAVVLLRAGDFMGWFGGGGLSGREYGEQLERERVARVLAERPRYDETGFLGWTFPSEE